MWLNKAKIMLMFNVLSLNVASTTSSKFLICYFLCRHESTVIQKITGRIFSELHCKFSSVFKDLVGIDSCVVWETTPLARFYDMLGQTHVNGWSRVIASQNGGSTDYIFPLRLGVLQWSRHLFNYWKNKKTIIEKEFLILLIWNWIYIWS